MNLSWSGLIILETIRWLLYDPHEIFAPTFLYFANKKFKNMKNKPKKGIQIFDGYFLPYYLKIRLAI